MGKVFSVIAISCLIASLVYSLVVFIIGAIKKVKQAKRVKKEFDNEEKHD